MPQNKDLTHVDINFLETQLNSLSFASPVANHSRRLPWDLLATLFQDIKERGGVHKVNLNLLCEEKPHIYGPTFSKLRTQVQNKVYKLRKLSPKDYQKAEKEAYHQFLLTNSETPNETVETSCPVTPIVNTPVKPVPTSPSFKKPDASPTLSTNPFAFTMNNNFGTVPHDQLIEFKDRCWMNYECTIWKSEAIMVGRAPTIMAPTINIAITNVDDRFFTNDLSGWKPYVATQVSPNRIVVEMPKGSYDFYFNEMILSEEEKEQMTFETHRNRLKVQDRSTWRKKYCIQFPFNLNYAIIDHNNRNGQITMGFKGGVPESGPHQRLSVVWRIAVVPENPDDVIVQAQQAVDENPMDLFARHLAGT